MPSIPMIQWDKKNGGSSEFLDFRLVADKDIQSRLSRDLGFFNLSKNSPDVLRLSISHAAGLSPEAFSMIIASREIKIIGSSLHGLHHGLCALKQLLWSHKGLLFHGEATQTPAFEKRGVMLDVSRGKMATLSYLKNLVSFLSDLGYNIFQLYSEDKLALKKHPLVGSVTGAYTKEQIAQLDAWCLTCFIELQPCIQTFSHMHGLLSLPGYCRLSENDDMFSMAPGNGSVYAFLEDELEETLPWFSSSTLNVNMDEAFDIGTGFSKDESEKSGKAGVFLRHIRRVYEIAVKHGVKDIVMWGDFAAKYSDQLDKLPPGITFADWNYNPQEEFPSLDLMQNSGMPYWAAGGTSSWNSLFPRMYNAYTNLVNLSCESLKKGARGFLVTDWGDYGHMQPLGLSLYAYMIGAQQAWHAKETEIASFEQQAMPLVFGDSRLEAAFHHLMASNLAPDLQQGFKTMSLYAFFDDLLLGLSNTGSKLYPPLGRDTFLWLEEKGRAALELLEAAAQEDAIKRRRYPDEAWEDLFGPAFINELRLVARATAFTGKKGLLGCEVRQMLSNSVPTVDDLLMFIHRIKLLYGEFLKIRRAFVPVWASRAYEQGMDGCMSLFDKAGVQMGEAVKWLSLQLSALRTGGIVDSSLESYAAGRDYRILWTADFRNLWDRAYPWQ